MKTQIPWNDLNLTLEAQSQEAEWRPLCMSTVAFCTSIGLYKSERQR